MDDLPRTDTPRRSRWLDDLEAYEKRADMLRFLLDYRAHGYAQAAAIDRAAEATR